MPRVTARKNAAAQSLGRRRQRTISPEARDQMMARVTSIRLQKQRTIVPGSAFMRELARIII